MYGECWPASAIAQLLIDKLFENSYAACHALAKSATVGPDSERRAIADWARRYRLARVGGFTSDEAARIADETGA